MTIAENLVLAARRGQPRGLGLALKSEMRRELHERVRRLNLGSSTASTTSSAPCQVGSGRRSRC